MAKYKIIGIIVAFALVFSSPPAAVLSQSSAQLQGRIDRLNAEIAENQERLHRISHEADTLQAKVNAINAEITGLQKQIDLANLQIAKTQAKIVETIKQLEKQKQIMFENARVLYKLGTPTTIEILASSDNFSEFINKQEYLTAVKENVNQAAREITALKDDLEAKQKELEEFVKQQEVQRAILASKRDEQAYLLEKTKGEEAEYQALVANLRAKRNAAELALLSTSPRGGNGVGAVVRAGQNVVAGQTVGYMGDSGFSEGPHLHFALIEGNSYQNPGPYLNGGATWPAPGYTTITQPYGCVPNTWYNQAHCQPGYSFHRGLDIGGPYGARIVATEAGEVTFAGCWAGSGFGNVVIINHASGRQTYYPHLGSGCR